MELTAERLRNLLDYDPATGLFRYKVSKGPARAGEVAGTVGNHGYVQIRARGKKHLAHRLAWLYVHGVWPRDYLDHKNRDKTDNRIANLRECCQCENMQNRKIGSNNKSGCKGVNWHAATGTWQARITVNKVRIQLGWFTNLHDAITARNKAVAALHPFSTDEKS